MVAVGPIVQVVFGSLWADPLNINTFGNKQVALSTGTANEVARQRGPLPRHRGSWQLTIGSNDIPRTPDTD